MNGFSTGEEDSRGPTDQTCCLFDHKEKCLNPAGNASYSKRIQKTVTLRRLNLSIDSSVCTININLHISITLFHRPDILTYVISINQLSNVLEPNLGAKIQRMIAMKPILMFQKLICINYK